MRAGWVLNCITAVLRTSSCIFCLPISQLFEMEPEELTPKVECWWGFWYRFSTFPLYSAKKEVSISKSISETLWCIFCYLEREESHHGNVQIRGLHIAFKPWAPHANHANSFPKTTRRQLFIITENASKTSALPSRGAGHRTKILAQVEFWAVLLLLFICWDMRPFLSISLVEDLQILGKQVAWVIGGVNQHFLHLTQPDFFFQFLFCSFRASSCLTLFQKILFKAFVTAGGFYKNWSEITCTTGL